jgi:hypothetical protein
MSTLSIDQHPKLVLVLLLLAHFTWYIYTLPKFEKMTKKQAFVSPYIWSHYLFLFLPNIISYVYILYKFPLIKEFIFK